MNCNVHFLFYLVLTIVRQDTKICNETTNDFSESCLWIFADSRYFADTEVLNNYALIMQEKSLFR